MMADASASPAEAWAAMKSYILGAAAIRRALASCSACLSLPCGGGSAMTYNPVAEGVGKPGPSGVLAITQKPEPMRIEPGASSVHGAGVCFAIVQPSALASLPLRTQYATPASTPSSPTYPTAKR